MADNPRAALYHVIAEAFAALAVAEDTGVWPELSEVPDFSPQPPPTQLRPMPQVHVPPKPQPIPGPAPVLDVNIATHCPKHGTEYRKGNYGPYCPNPTDDPAFADRKGYCALPGKDAQKALDWVRIQEAASNVR
jgi:hypothetical protein